MRRALTGAPTVHAKHARAVLIPRITHRLASARGLRRGHVLRQRAPLAPSLGDSAQAHHPLADPHLLRIHGGPRAHLLTNDSLTY